MSKNRNRGKLSNDDKWFAPKWHPVFSTAADDLAYLYQRGYGENASLQIVGNRYRLNKRQRNAVSRISCSHDQIELRNGKCMIENELKGRPIEIDGFNLLILLESALSGAYIFKARDGLYRDISSVHGSYKRVVKTEEALILIGNVVKKLEPSSVKWYLDSPVSNSGRLKTKLLHLSEQYDFDWEVDLVFDPDKVLAKSNAVIVTSDGWILDQSLHWFNLGKLLIEQHIPEANVLAV